jgi:peroxiredoxin
MIKEGERLPDASFVVMDQTGAKIYTTQEIFGGRKVALFGLPGAYTPVCHKEHLPGIAALYDQLVAAGIDAVACTAVNDAFVLQRWARDHGVQRKVLMLADGNAEFARKAGLAVDLSEFGLGIRTNRYAMIVTDAKVDVLGLEDMISDHAKSSAASMCAFLEERKSA